MILEKIFKSVYADLQGGTQDDSAMSDKLSVLIENVSLDTMDQKKLEDVFNNVDAASANVNSITQCFTGVGESI